MKASYLLERALNSLSSNCYPYTGYTFLPGNRFNIKEKEAKYLEKFFSYIEIEIAKEEKDNKLKEIEFNLISDTKEVDEEISDYI
ncbi:hypothetical protein N7504_006269 [Penicillium tannophilum]|nr:hypothetical protein N7504_006269 [Penicillium tannophilum]